VEYKVLNKTYLLYYSVFPLNYIFSLLMSVTILGAQELDLY